MESRKVGRAALSPQRARQIRPHRHERLARRGDGCGFEFVKAMLPVFPSARAAMQKVSGDEMFAGMWGVCPLLREIRVRPQTEGRQASYPAWLTTSRTFGYFGFVQRSSNRSNPRVERRLGGKRVAHS